MSGHLTVFVDLPVHEYSQIFVYYLIQEGAACHTGSSTEIPDEQEAMFNELFTAAGSDDGEAALEDMMKKLMSGQPEMMQQLESMAQNLDTIGKTVSNDCDESKKSVDIDDNQRLPYRVIEFSSHPYE